MKAGWTAALALLVIGGCGSDEQQTVSPPCAAPPLPAVAPRETSRRVSVDNAYAVHERLLGKAQPDENLSALNPGERAVYAVLFLEAEVNNGGHFQFFFNTGQLTDEALAGLQRLEAKEYGQLLQRVVAQFPGCDVPDDLDDVQAEIDKMSPEQEALVESILRARRGKDAWRYAAEYISAHPDEF